MNKPVVDVKNVQKVYGKKGESQSDANISIKTVIKKLKIKGEYYE
ncbi:TPA: hypothetical protein ACTZ5W_006041 [Bacillus cereus]